MERKLLPRAILLCALLAVAAGTGVSAREIHVSTEGSDSGLGTAARPYGTISKAASVVKPGDTVTVHGGTYREWVKPVKGGTGEDNRITFRAAPGERVVVKGSERITSWEQQENGVWKAEIRNSFFGDYNPYELKVSGPWLNYGQWHHRGGVYLNGRAFLEKKTPREVAQEKHTWHCEVKDGSTTIRANFGEADPNAEMTEINVRRSLFMPEVTGLRYITVDGFHFKHAAPNWAPPTLELQQGAVGPRMGKNWVIRNCTIADSRCVGIILGHAPGVDYSDIDAYGDHVIRDNVIRRCGQAGIAGQKGATRSLITHNLIEDTNYRREFGGWETAAIKFHNSVDTVIRDNLIRGVYHQRQGAFGIWIDFGNQGVRISRNIIYDTQAATVFLEMNHGPILVDNNVLIGQDVKSNSEATVFAHNLFVDCGYTYRPDTRRQSAYYKPHTTRAVGRRSGTAREDKWYNNIFVRAGLEGVKDAPGYESDYNAFLGGAGKSSFDDAHSVVDDYAPEIDVKTYDDGAKVSFTVNDAPFGLDGPRVDADMVGVFTTVGQTIEDRYGNPIAVEMDINGRRREKFFAGPLANLTRGRNAIEWHIETR